MTRPTDLLSLPPIVSAIALLLVTSCLASAAEWQWAVPVEQTHGLAYLWIPPSCKRVRGLIVSDVNMIERQTMESPIIRAAAEKAGLGMVLFVPKTFFFFKYKDGVDQVMLKTLADLAKESGYSEIEFCPLMSLGHSASTPFAWFVGYWQPQRTIAVLSLKGGTFPPPDFDKTADAREVPAFAISGEYYEWPTKEKSRLHWHADRDVALKLRDTSRPLLTFFAETSRGHFDWSDGLANLMAMYIIKAAQQRLPDDAPLDGPVTLKKIDPASGWLIDGNTVQADHVPPAPVSQYKGDPTKASWAFDKEMADAIDRYGMEQKTKAYQMVTFLHDGQPLDGAEKGYADIRFEPTADDELVFKLAGTYLDQTPPALSNQPALTGHSTTPLYFQCLGPAVQIAPDTFRLRCSRFFPSTTLPLSMLVCSPGDDKYRQAFQPGVIKVPPNKEGRPQKITFQKIPNQTAGTKSLALTATSDANLPVEFFVRFGPAEVDGNRLTLTPIPPRSKLPIKICVAAYQPGQAREPKVQAAPTVEQTFYIDSRP